MMALGVRALLALSWIITLVQKCSSVCYFGLEYQGLYVTQSIISGGSDLHYLEVVIQADSIPVWGMCHRRLGNNVILYDKTGGTDCVRCFHLSVRSAHILEVHTEGLDKCYTNEAAALTTCPTQDDINNKRTREVMLYKTLTIEGQPLEPAYCPIDGRFQFTFNKNDGTEGMTECPEPTSSISNCPAGNHLNLHFKRCTFGDFSKHLECLGSWEGSDGQRYLALHDPEAELPQPPGERSPPRFRCAMYKVEEGSGRVFLSFSSDSTCINNLHSAWEGYETLVLTPEPPTPPSHQISTSTCAFPAWSQGVWEHVRVEGNMLTYTDMKSYKTYRVFCLDNERNGIVPVYAQTQCGDEVFTCLALQRRSNNVMEFQMSPDSSDGYDPELCRAPQDRTWDRWLTQGRVDRFKQSPCPVAGEYTGRIPDAPVLCAKLYSDCNNPEIMFYTVYYCFNRTQVIEEREYRCLGQWAETGVTYTYTERRDQKGYECFAGVVVNNGELYIIEAGNNCQRGLQALSYGMNLKKQAPCLNARPHYPRASTPSPAPPPAWWTTKNPWTKKPHSSTEKPGWKDTPKDAGHTSTSSSLLTLLAIVATILIRT